MSALVSTELLDRVRLDMDAVGESVHAVVTAAADLRTATDDGGRVWVTMPAAFDIPGVSESLGVLTEPSSRVAADLEDAAHGLRSVVDRASADFAVLRTRRAALVDRIEAFVGGIGRAVADHDDALADPPAAPSSWRDVPTLHVGNAALLRDITVWNTEWDDFQCSLAGAITGISGGDSIAGLATSPPGVHTASVVGPAPISGFPAFPQIGGILEGLRAWVAASGVGAGAAVGGATAAEVFALLFGLSGDTAQQSPSDVRARQLAQANADAWAWTHDPLTGKVRERAGGGSGTMFDVEGPKDAAEAIDIATGIGRPGVSPPHREVESAEDLVDAWKELTRGGAPVSGGARGATSVRLPDGTRIQWRPDSGSEGPAIDVHPPRTSDFPAIKIHVPKGSEPYELPTE